MMNRPSVRIPSEIAQLLSSGLIKNIEYSGESVLVSISTKEFFHRVLQGSEIELVEVDSNRIVLRIPLTFFSE
jgi:hypothetical protein